MMLIPGSVFPMTVDGVMSLALTAHQEIKWLKESLKRLERELRLLQCPQTANWSA